MLLCGDRFKQSTAKRPGLNMQVVSSSANQDVKNSKNKVANTSTSSTDISASTSVTNINACSSTTDIHVTVRE